jgi:hypothetical protein
MQATKKLFPFLLLLIANGIIAQNFQLAGINFSHHAKTKVEGSATGAELESQVVGAFVRLPLKFKNQKTVLMNTLRYARVQQIAYNSQLFLDAKRTSNLHLIAYSPMLIQSLGGKWSILAGITPSIASDLKEKLSSDDFLVQASLLASAKLNEKWTLGGGAVYTTQLGDPRFLPALQLRYLHNKHFINVLLPSYMNYLYRVGQAEKLRLGIRLETNGGKFNVINSDYTQVFPNTIDKIIYSRVNMGAVVHFQATETILLEAFGGLGAARKFELRDEADKNFKADAENGGFFNFGIILTPPSKAAEKDRIEN